MNPKILIFFDQFLLKLFKIRPLLEKKIYSATFRGLLKFDQYFQKKLIFDQFYKI
jgi:hypothetical protein